MRGKPRRSVWRWPLIGLACLLGLVCLWMVVGPIVRSWHVGRAIAHFEESPSQAGADSLVGLLQSHAATTEQGGRILALLRRPTVTTRRTYPAGLPVVIAVDRPFRLDFRDTLWQEEMIWVEGGQRRGRSGPDGESPETLYLRGLSDYQAKPGIHHLTVRGTYSLGLQRRGRLTKAGYYLRELLRMLRLSLPKGWQPARRYDCEFEMPVEVTVVPKDEAEDIELASSPALDEAMRAAFRVRSSGLHSLHDTPSGQVQFDSLKAIAYHDLPMAVAFRLVLRLSNEQTPGPPVEYLKQLLAQAHSSGSLALYPWNMLVDRPGTYTGTAILIPDPNIAYEDPAIEAIWNGTLEFPVSFTISKQPNQP